MPKRLNLTLDDETALRVSNFAVDQDRPDSNAAARLIKEALDARDDQKKRGATK